MRTYLKLFAALCALFAPTLGYPQESAATDAFLYTITLPTAVHFIDPEGQDLLVPTGTYWVSPAEQSLQLLNLQSGVSFILAAIAGGHGEELSEALALSTGGTEDEPDAHVIAFMFVDGTQLIAEGTYSGIQSRGRLADAARKKAAGARIEAAKRAAEAKRRAINTAAAARRKAEEAAAELQRLAQLARERALQLAYEKITSSALVPIIQNIMSALEGGLSNAEKNAIRGWAAARLNSNPALTNAMTSIGERLAEVKERVRDEVIIPVGMNRITPNQAGIRFRRLIGQELMTALENALAQSSQRVSTRGDGNAPEAFYTFVVGLNGSAAFVGGIQLPANGMPSIAVGALHDEDQHNFGFVWSGGGKLGVTAEVSAEVTFSWFYGRPEDLSGGYIGYTMGGSTPTGVSVGLAISQYAAMKSIKDFFEGKDRGGLNGWLDANFLGQSVSVSIGVGIPVDASIVAGGTIVLVPGKVLDYAKGLVGR